MYIVSGTSVTASAAAPLDSYMLFLDEKQNKGGYRTSNKAQVTFDRNIKAVLWGNSSTGRTTVGTMTVGGTGSSFSYASGSQRGFEKENGVANPYRTSSSGTVDGDWFHVSGKTIYAGAKNKYPGDFLRVIVEGAVSNTAPVAADYTKSVTENTYSKNPSYFSIRDNSTDADGDTLTVTNIKYDKFTNDGDTSVEPGEVENVTELSLIHI